jgi:uncharacterized protein YuzE
MEGKINFFFDEEGDVLDITIGKPKKAVAKELKNDIAIRCDPETGEIVGIVILNFKKRFKQKKKPEEIELPLNISITTN